MTSVKFAIDHDQDPYALRVVGLPDYQLLLVEAFNQKTVTIRLGCEGSFEATAEWHHLLIRLLDEGIWILLECADDQMDWINQHRLTEYSNLTLIGK